MQKYILEKRVLFEYSFSTQKGQVMSTYFGFYFDSKFSTKENVRKKKMKEKVCQNSKENNVVLPILSFFK